MSRGSACASFTHVESALAVARQSSHEATLEHPRACMHASLASFCALHATSMQVVIHCWLHLRHLWLRRSSAPRHALSAPHAQFAALISFEHTGMPCGMSSFMRSMQIVLRIVERQAASSLVHCARGVNLVSGEQSWLQC